MTMPDEYAQSLDVILSLWRQALLGTLLLLGAVAVGSTMARDAAGPPVRLVGWWIQRVVLPLLRSRTWWRRALTIAVNNTVVLAILVLFGRWPVAPIIGVSIVGISLGIGLRLLGGWAADWEVATGGGRLTWPVRLGMALNMLEPPVIVLAIGLSLGRRPFMLTPEEVWWTFVLWGLPALWVAAGGEALWLGAARFTGGGDQSTDTPNDAPPLDS